MQFGRYSLYKTCRAVWKFEAGCLLLVPPSFVLHIHRTDNCRWTWNPRRSPIHRFAWHLRCQDMHIGCSANSERHELMTTRRWEGCLTTARRSSWWYDDYLITQAYFTGIATVVNAKRVALHSWRPIVLSARGLITCLSRPMIALTASRLANLLVGLYGLLQKGLIETLRMRKHLSSILTVQIVKELRSSECLWFRNKHFRSLTFLNSSDNIGFDHFDKCQNSCRTREIEVFCQYMNQNTCRHLSFKWTNPKMVVFSTSLYFQTNCHTGYRIQEHQSMYYPLTV